MKKENHVIHELHQILWINLGQKHTQLNYLSFRNANKVSAYILFIIAVVATTSCKKFISVDPPLTSVSQANVYKDDATAAAVLTGIYTSIAKGNDFTSASSSISAVSYYTALSADELTLYNGVSDLTLLSYYQNALKLNNTGSSDFWYAFYPVIYYANTAIDGINQSTQLSPNVSKQLLGEAYFIRAFCYFYLINLYGDVPLVLTPNYSENSTLPRTPKTVINQQIINDLKLAEGLLSKNFVDAGVIKTTTERVRPNWYAANALLARVYLYSGNYSDAEIQATNVIDNKVLFDTVSLKNNVFNKNSKETIWAIQPVLGTTLQNTGEGRLFILPASGPSVSNPVYLSDILLNSFEFGDARKTYWTTNVKVGSITYNYAYKYKIGSVNTATAEYSMVLRLAEQYLIRAEARYKQGNLTGAADDLNLIRKRAGLTGVSSASPSLLTYIYHERQVELFTEWGHRWLDLKRNGTINTVMTTVTQQKGGSWDPRWALYPIPKSELTYNPQLTPNPGYEN